MTAALAPLRLSLAALGLGLTCSCSYLVFDEPGESAAEVFDQVWADFDQYYGLFEVKGVDWDQQYAELAPAPGDDLSEAELHARLVALLEPLDDKHVSLFPAGSSLPTWSVDLVDGRFPTPPLDLALIKADYLDGDWIAPHPLVFAGRLSPTIGYVHIAEFGGSLRSYEKAFDAVFEQLDGVEAMVVDVRDNPGGFDPIVQLVANRFATERAVYMRARKRNGPGRADFGPAQVWEVEPVGPGFRGPVALLTTYATQSAGETFTLAMRRRAGLVQIGDTTAGAFSDNIMREAGNGWTYTISVGDYRDHEGVSWEGVGLAPDLEIVNTAEDLEAGQDRVLEAAIARLAEPVP